MIRITVEASDLARLEAELEVVLLRLRSTRSTGTPAPVPSMPLADPPANAPLCPEHPGAGPMTYKPADQAKGRPAAWWCSFYGCRQRVPA